MSTATVRVKESVLNSLRQQAERRGVSLQALVDEVLEREVTWGPQFGLRPFVLPVGLSPQADGDFQAALESRAVLFIMYTDRNGALVSLPGTVRSVLPTYIELSIWQDAELIRVPRDAIRLWQAIPSSANVFGEVIVAAKTCQRFGAVLHVSVTLDAKTRADRGLL